MILAVALLLLIGQACNTKNEKQENMESDKTALNAIFPKVKKVRKNFHWKRLSNRFGRSRFVYNTAGNVYFEPGARSNWHSHPSGQILIITDGIGYYQIEGQPIEIMKKGDVVKFPPNVRHWHGASPDVGLQQLYIIPNTERGLWNGWSQYQMKNTITVRSSFLLVVVLYGHGIRLIIIKQTRCKNNQK
jgi:quercetin dioxygenase-like cupin family protein